MRPALAAAALLCCACPKAPAAVPTDDCTLQTPLVPGVPGSPGNLIPSQINANGASELATLMRRMKADLEAAREALGRAEKPKAMLEVHRKMRCSWPTAAEDRNPAFDASAVAYLAAVRGFDAAPAPGTYQGIIGACLACHANTCPGPVDAIQTLHLPAAPR